LLCWARRRGSGDGDATGCNEGERKTGRACGRGYLAVSPRKQKPLLCPLTSTTACIPPHPFYFTHSPPPPHRTKAQQHHGGLWKLQRNTRLARRQHRLASYPVRHPCRPTVLPSWRTWRRRTFDPLDPWRRYKGKPLGVLWASDFQSRSQASWRARRGGLGCSELRWVWVELL